MLSVRSIHSPKVTKSDTDHETRHCLCCSDEKCLVLHLQLNDIMNLQELLKEKVDAAVKAEFGHTLPTLEFQPTRKDFEGDITLVLFPMLRYIKGTRNRSGSKLAGTWNGKLKQ